MGPRLSRHAFALAMAITAVPALAAPCAGFTDVDSTLVSPEICQSVEWIKNRQITLGCPGVNLYCPGDAVSRAAMALFLNRLGTALTPQLTFVEEALAAVNPDASPKVCWTASISAKPYPRQAIVSIAFGGQSAGDLGFSARPMVSIDSGVNWSPLGSVAIRESVVGAAWTNTAASGIYAIPASQTVRFAVGVQRESGTSDFTQGRCHLTAGVVNANGTSSPF